MGLYDRSASMAPKQPVLFLPPPPEHPPPSDIGTPPDSPTDSSYGAHLRDGGAGVYSSRGGGDWARASSQRAMHSDGERSRHEYAAPHDRCGTLGPRMLRSVAQQQQKPRSTAQQGPASQSVSGALSGGARAAAYSRTGAYVPPGHRTDASPAAVLNARVYSASHAVNELDYAPNNSFQSHCGDRQRLYGSSGGDPNGIRGAPPPGRMMPPYGYGQPATNDPTAEQSIQASIRTLVGEYPGWVEGFWGSSIVAETLRYL